ncbi:MAG TPA: tetratricopeptide repeat protein [Candidatus Saccharimonadales bacterium]|nr:tetratricopeptide repeat protein [Candidatus Saccharimonadales bacterium]
MYRAVAVVFLIGLGSACLAVFVQADGPLNINASAQAVEDFGPGVVVEKVARNSAAERAGLQEGDVILRWVRGDAKGDIESPFDLLTLETEEAPLGPLTLEGTRDARRQTWKLKPDAWGLDTRANFGPELLLVYQQTQDPDATNKLARLVQRDSGLSWVRAWLFFQRARQLGRAKQWIDADKAFAESVQQSARAGPKVSVIVLMAWAGVFLDRGDLKGEEKLSLQALAESQKTGVADLTTGLALNSLGTAAERRGDLTKAEDYHRQALEIRQKLAPGSLSVAASLNGLGMVAYGRGDYPKAEEYHLQALAFAQEIAPDSLAVATSLNGLGNAVFKRGDLTGAEKYHSRALSIRERLAPASMDVAASFSGLALIAWQRGDLNRAEELQRRDLAIGTKLAPGSLEVSTSLTNLGVIVWQRGDLDQAAELQLQALAIKEKFAPDSLRVANSLHGLSMVADERGDLIGAEEYERRALAIRERLAPRSHDVAISLNMLGNIADDRGDLMEAEGYYRQALLIHQKSSPGSVAVAVSLHNLGLIAKQRGDLVTAKEYFQQALSIREKVSPDSLGVAIGLGNLGIIAQRQNDPAAEEYFRRALAIKEKIAPGSLTVANSLHNLAEIAMDRGDLESAERGYRQALAITGAVAPVSVQHAENLAALASVMRRQKQPDRAADFYRQTLNALEGQITQLGGTDQVRAAFRADHATYYKEYIDLLISQKQTELAFEVLERSRGRSLLELLAMAHADIRKGVDAALVEREHSLRAGIAARSGRRLRLVSDAHTEEEVAAFDQEINGLLSRYRDVEGQIRATSPGYAALTQPQPLTAKEVEQLLDEDTLLLEYLLGDERSYVFAVTPSSIAVYELPRRAEIESMARQVYQLWTEQNRVIGSESGFERQERLRKTGKESESVLAALSRAILGPMAGQLKAKRLLIVSDGALQYIPFAALPDPESSGPDGEQDRVPLVVGHEIVSLPSASVLAIIRREAATHKKAPKAVAVLADPVFSRNDVRVSVAATVDRQRPNRKTAHGKPDRKEQKMTMASASSAQVLTRSATEVGLLQPDRPYLPRLPFSRREAKAILSVTLAGQGMQALDFQASRATATGPDLSQYRVVHFATHGLLNSEHPELSGLVLSLVDAKGTAQNGFLGLEDVYNLNLSADLVVLSACETALGKEIQGEGLLGLTRGFMYAGASQVVASLWSVDDAATAELMRHFYRAMEQDGMGAAAALRRAQIEIRKQERWRRPYYWAGFVIQGEWK